MPATQKKILIVEDNPDNRELFCAFLQSRYDTDACGTAFEALGHLGNPDTRPDLILCDIGLPVMDGVELLKEIKDQARLRRIPVIALTAFALTGDRERFLSAGFDDYISKPIMDDDALFGPIERLLSAGSTE